MKVPMINDDRTTREDAWKEGYRQAIEDVKKVVNEEVISYNSKYADHIHTMYLIEDIENVTK